MRMLILTAAQAAAVDPSPNLWARPIDAGPEAGNFAMNAAVLDAPVNAPFLPVLSQGRVVDLDVAAAWPDA